MCFQKQVQIIKLCPRSLSFQLTRWKGGSVAVSTDKRLGAKVLAFTKSGRLTDDPNTIVTDAIFKDSSNEFTMVTDTITSPLNIILFNIKQELEFGQQKLQQSSHLTEKPKKLFQHLEDALKNQLSPQISLYKTIAAIPIPNKYFTAGHNKCYNCDSTRIVSNTNCGGHQIHIDKYVKTIYKIPRRTHR